MPSGRPTCLASIRGSCISVVHVMVQLPGPVHCRMEVKTPHCLLVAPRLSSGRIFSIALRRRWVGTKNLKLSQKGLKLSQLHSPLSTKSEKSYKFLITGAKNAMLAQTMAVDGDSTYVTAAAWHCRYVFTQWLRHCSLPSVNSSCMDAILPGFDVKVHVLSLLCIAFWRIQKLWRRVQSKYVSKVN